MKRVLVFGGPTGAGETTITKKLSRSFPIFGNWWPQRREK